VKVNNSFVIREVENGWIVEINGRFDRLGDMSEARVYQQAWEVEGLLRKFASKSRQKRNAEKPVPL
jgi:hypothetical protein